MSSHPFQNFIVRFASGDRIFTEGDLGVTMYIVQGGRVRLFRAVDGQKRVQAEMEKGDFFGEMSILEGLPRNCSAEAAEDAELIEINSMTFDKMIKGNIEIAVRLLRKLSLRLRATEQKLEELLSTGHRPTSLAPAMNTTTAARTSQSITSGFRLLVEDEGVVFSLAGNETLIGRFDPVTEQKPDIDLTEVDLKRSVSRRHARIVRSGDHFSLMEEVGALNGTFVNGSKLETGQAHPIAEGDELGVGMVKLIFRT